MEKMPVLGWSMQRILLFGQWHTLHSYDNCIFWNYNSYIMTQQNNHQLHCATSNSWYITPSDSTHYIVNIDNFYADNNYSTWLWWHQVTRLTYPLQLKVRTSKILEKINRATSCYHSHTRFNHLPNVELASVCMYHVWQCINRSLHRMYSDSYWSCECNYAID